MILKDLRHEFKNGRPVDRKVFVPRPKILKQNFLKIKKQEQSLRVVYVKKQKSKNIKCIIFEGMNQLLRNGIIKKTTYSGLNPENYLEFKVVTYKKIKISMFFIYSKNVNALYTIIDSTSRSLMIELGRPVGTENIYSCLKGIVQNHLFGFQNEEDFIEAVKGFNSIVSIKITNDEDNMNGTDFIIEYYDNKGCVRTLRLQLKSNREDQKKHEKDFPDIASIVWTKKYFSDFVLKNKMKTIINADQDGKIVHV